MPLAPNYAWVVPGVTAFIAPPGTPMNDSAAWKQIGGPPGASFVNGRIHYDEATRDWMAANWIFPQTWMTGVEQPKLSEANLKPYLEVIDETIAERCNRLLIEYFDRELVVAGSNTSTPNKRSKPMTLTMDHKYTDNDGDTLTIAKGDEEVPEAIAWIDQLSNPCGFNVTAKNSVPLALNVLGYDRPKPGDGSHVTVDGFFVPGIRILSDGQRAELAAKAISYLKSVDIYDQQAVERKAAKEAEAKAAELAAAKARVEVANREIAERLLRKAKAAYQDAIISAYKSETTPESYRSETTPESAAKLQAALSAYETARRKFEGLPN